MDSQVSANDPISTSPENNLSNYFKTSLISSLEGAERHRLASRVTQIREIEISTLSGDSRCECCLFPVDARPFRLTALDSLSELGIAFPLYFHLARHIALMLLIVSVVAAIPDTILNLALGTTSLLPLTRFSIAMHDDPVPSWSIALHLIAIILICLVYIYTTLRMKALTIKLSEGISTPSQFALLVKNLGREWNSDDLKRHIEEKMQINGQPIKIARINTCYDITEFERVLKNISKNKLKQEKYRKQQFQSPSTFRRCWNTLLCARIFHIGPITEENIKTEMIELDEKIAAIAKQEWKKTGVAVVVLETNVQAKTLVVKWKRGIVRRYLCCCLSFMDEELVFNGRRIYIKKAPEPNDIMWGNLKFTRLRRVLTQLLAIGIVIGVLFINFTCLFYIANEKAGTRNKHSHSFDCYYPETSNNTNPFGVSKAYENTMFLYLESVSNFSASRETEISEFFSLGTLQFTNSNNTSTEMTCNADKTSLISLAVGYSIVLLNLLIKIVSHVISAAEHHHSHTTESLFLAWKLIIFLSINLILFPLLVNLETIVENFAEGLAPDVFWTVVIQAILIPLTEFISPVLFALKRRYYRYRIQSASYFISQETLNKHFEYPEVDISAWYVALICKFLLTLAYAVFIPVVAPIMCVGIVIEYWIKKYTLLRLSRRPKPMNHRLPRVMMQFVKPAMVLYAIGMGFSCTASVGDESKGVSIAALCISFVFLCVPVSSFKVCFKRFLPKSNEDKEMKYEEAANHFFVVSDSQRYELSNPVTRVQELADQSQHLSALKQFAFEEKVNSRLPIASMCIPLSRRQSQAMDVTSFWPSSSDYLRMPDEQINS